MKLFIDVQDVNDNSQRFLRGHAHAVTALHCTADKRVILSADSGPDSRLLAWSAEALTQLWALPRPHTHGVVAMDVLPDGSRLATLAACPATDAAQDIAIWDVSESGPPTRLLSVAVPTGDLQVHAQT